MLVRTGGWAPPSPAGRSPRPAAAARPTRSRSRRARTRTRSRRGGGTPVYVCVGGGEGCGVRGGSRAGHITGTPYTKHPITKQITHPNTPKHNQTHAPTSRWQPLRLSSPPLLYICVYTPTTTTAINPKHLPHQNHPPTSRWQPLRSSPQKSAKGSACTGAQSRSVMLVL